MSLVRFKPKNHRQQISKRGADNETDDRRTPIDLFNSLNIEFGFTIDVAASNENALLPKFYTKDDDGLTKDWDNERVWCNPPYSDLSAWVEKSLLEINKKCSLVCLLLPANRCEQKFWQDYIEPVRDQCCGYIKIQTRFLRGRHRFGWPPNRIVPKKGDRPPFGLVVVIIQKRNR